MKDDADDVADAAGRPSPAPLSVHRAFVVQFRESPKPSRKIWRGRVEHVASGESAAFTSRAGLMAFLAARLRARSGDGSKAATGSRSPSVRSDEHVTTRRDRAGGGTP